MNVHPTAIVNKDAVVSPSADIGPYCVIDAGARIGDRCRLEPYVRIHTGSSIGSDNVFHSGCVIGDAPQDLKYDGAPTQLRIGDSNTFREGFTAHRSANLEEETRVGNNGYYMANSHVGHNSVIGDHVILANGALIGGHVSVGSKAFISGNAAIHQYVRVGRLSMIHGCSGITQDVPPFAMVTEPNQLCGLNRIGVQRAGFSVEDRDSLKQLYRLLFFSKAPLQDALHEARSSHTSEIATELIQFMEAKTSRGFCSRRARRGR